MITYKTLVDGSLSESGIKLIPATHRLYTKELAKVEAGEAEILPYIKSTPTSLSIRNNALADITWMRSDGIEIQIRHPDYASDYLLMDRAKDQLAEGESRWWISKDDRPVMLSKEDMIECLAHGDSEISRIYAEHIATL